MSDFSPRRFLLLIALAFVAGTTLASTPSARIQPAMAYDAAGRRMILFGGVTQHDSGTKQAYYLSDTWQFGGSKWVQLFPQHSPSERSGESMVYDSIRNHIVLFGGRNLTTELNDTWFWNGNDWVKIDTPNSPPARFLAGAAYDSIRDRVIVFGGTKTTASGTTVTASSLYDTWEFDGTTWRQIGGEGPHVSKPRLVYDESRDQVYMMGIDDKSNALMYAYDAKSNSWRQLTPSTLPACANEGVLVYETSKSAPLFTSGVCSTTATDNETLEWDGTTWKKVDVKTNVSRLYGTAAAYDIARDITIVFGGATLAQTYLYTEGAWTTVSDGTVPGPRSLFSFVTDPFNQTIWLFGGVSEFGSLEDLWRFQNGIWTEVTVTANAPAACGRGNAVFDTDRQKLVVVCEASATYEFDGAAWKKFDNLKTIPATHAFAGMVYDQNLKKTVLFGGLEGTNNYSDQTWLWDGTQWSQVKNNRAPSRELPSMWYDPTLKRTVLFGGVGRLTSQDRVTRFNDTWSFDGNGWTQLKPATMPGARYGASVVVDPKTNHAILFGGLRVDTVPPTPPATIPLEVQVYANDMWEWDGSTWTKRAPNGIPPVRENAGLAYDPTLNVIVLYGGWAGRYLSDMWMLTGNTWRVRPDSPGGPRRRVAVH